MAIENPHPFLFLSANTPWVYALAEALSHDAPAHAVRLYDWRTWWQAQPDWPEPHPNADIERTLRVFPPGYTGALETVARPVLRWMIDRWRARLRAQTDREPYVVAPYPYLAPWVRTVPDDRLVYYNLDAYTRYRPERADRIREREAELVRRSVRTICLAQHQVELLRERHPDHADRIKHFPLGVVENFLNPTPTEVPEPDTVTYVGNMESRVDWQLVEEVVARCSGLTFRFVGGVEKRGNSNDADWRSARSRVLAQDNVEAVGRVPQDEVARYYWTSSVNWIPYDLDHPFNLASCPTKIMDGLASGRPLVSTPVPECELYPEWIDVAETPGELSAALRRRSQKFDADRAQRQVEKTGQHTWEHRADTLRSMLTAGRRTEVSNTVA